MPVLPRPSPAPRPLTGAAAVVGAASPAGAEHVAVSGVTLDSRSVRPGDLFAALPGRAQHGAAFASAAVAAGAVALLTDPGGTADCEATGVPTLVVPDPRSRLGDLAAWVYGEPAGGLLVLGVTGTNGKTTTSWLLESGLRAAGHVTGLVGTVGVHVSDEVLATPHTTPEAPDLHALLGLMRERGVTAVAMEVSSHALAQGRVDGLVLDVAGFTNLSQDHLDFHEDMAGYFAAKARLFSPAHTRRGVVAVDDGWGRRLARHATVPVATLVSLSDPPDPAVAADWRLHRVGGSSLAGHEFRMTGPEGMTLDLRSRLSGAFNRQNIGLAVALLLTAGVDPDAVARGIAAVTGVPGRMERVDRGQPFLALVDYAHTPDALAKVLAAVRPETDGRVIAVFGCGGDRDRGKRPRMGAVAAACADVVVVTDDNPRSERPSAIRAEVVAGAAGAGTAATVLEVPGRREALREAVARAAPGDVVVVAGKGHEQGQEVDGVVHPFDDREELGRVLAEVAAGRPGEVAR